MQTINTKVGIVGAGPAGTTASLFLDKKGINHVIVDKAVFPRDKVCGESYDGNVTSVLKHLDPSYLAQMEALDIVQKTRDYALMNSKHQEINLSIPLNKSPKLQGQRLLFDNFMVNEVKKAKAATLKEGVQINEVRYQNDKIILTDKRKEFEIAADLVIFAAGSQSTLIKQIESTPRKLMDKMLFQRRYYQNVNLESREYDVEFYIIRKPVPHYIYMGILPNNCSNVEFGIYKQDWERHGRPNLKQFFSDSIANHPVLSSVLADATLVSAKGTYMDLHRGQTIYSGERYLKAGSFASSINPFTGYGLGHAMRMGMLAAEQVAACFQQQDFSTAFLKNYDKAVKRKLWTEIQVGKALSWIQLNYLGGLDKAIGMVESNRFLSKGLVKILY